MLSGFEWQRSESTDVSDCTASSQSNFRREFAKRSIELRRSKSAHNGIHATSWSTSTQTESSHSSFDDDDDAEESASRSRRKHRHHRNRCRSKRLPPIGVFWDIENCHVPKNKSASSIVQRIRDCFFEGHREAEFIVACDIRKENPQIIQDLNDAQVNMIHVLCTSKNAADEKLRQSLRRFAETHPPPATVILISGDINFAADLSDLRYRKKITVILIHNSNAADALILCANKTLPFSTITDNLPPLKNKVQESVDLLVSNLPKVYDKRLKIRLKLLSDNCGGRVTEVNNDEGTAILRFSSLDFALRAQRRLNGEDVYGRKIVVSNPADWRSHHSPRNFAGRNKANKGGNSSDNGQLGYNLPSQCYNGSQQNAFYNQPSSGSRELSWRSFGESNTFRTSRSCPPHHQIEQVWSQRGFNGGSRPRTPQEETGNPLRSHKNGAATASCDFNDHKAFYSSNNTFQPINSGQQQTIELVISNFDSSIKDLRNVLSNLIKEYAMVYSINITCQPDGSPIALVKVGSQQDAHNIISKLHHYKLGFKRLIIAYTQSNTLDPDQLKEMVITLLQVNKLRDICRITDDNGERIISLTPEIRSSPPANLQRAHILYCSVHCPNGLNGIEDLGWDSEETDVTEIPHINMPLKVFANKLNTLLSSHMGTLPLLSFAVCYKHEFGETLPTDNKGVPLEHLVTCVSNVKLKYGGSNRNTKYIVRDIFVKSNEKDESFMTSLSPSITSNISLLSRELVDLLKTTERCQLQLNKYIPAYHHHFGRQLRVADYGYTKLSDLLHSQPISNVVQILGEGAKRIITLTHSTQMRRFTSDLLRVLKSLLSKQLTAQEFPAAYERVLNKSFNAIEYGLCCLDDLLDEVPENIIVITKKEDSISIAIPKREQTGEEIIRTKQFAEEVIKLLSYSPQCSMIFNKFVPAYHHHFGHQCKVSDYGFTKLIELFEAIPETVKVEELSDGERKVSLTLPKALNLRGHQIADLIKKSHLSYLPLEGLASSFQREYGFPLKAHYYECKDINELVSKLSDNVKITYSNAGPLLVPVENENQSTLTLRIWALLINPPHHMNLKTLIKLYNSRYQCNITMATLDQLNNVIINKSSNMESIFLSPQYSTAAKIYLMLYKEGGQVAYNYLENIYRKTYGVSLIQSEEDTFEKLLGDFSFLIVMRRTRKKTNIALNPKITDYGLLLPNTSNGGNNNNNHFARMDDGMSWPPPPAHDLVLDSNNRGITPPKPDTPPAPGKAPWNNWDTPTKFNSNMDFSISLPTARTPKLMGNSDSLISPTRNLLPANPHPMMPIMSPPAAYELPMPDKLLRKGIFSDDSTDSGVNNSQIVSENEMDISNNEQTGTKPKYTNLKPELLSYKM
ncbi:PREDICTED: meiosis arrest female protein 1 isoform X2 [Nicrophorus vespilloides]|uniref:Meiosis regulator and mRNA stability factor 1 n=1 Tax=Nicrophorus vespilloides TaxID=110193 RepID=A0ABM1MJ35_NICVS|nr:PREDICTED: meiosis arrest female protein 1 isoform X2 [Nicrophorus vespilloides]